MTDPAQQFLPLPVRDLNGHKGTFGTVAVIGGCARHASEDAVGTRMIGGPCLAALAALRGGVGLCRLLMPEPILTAGLTIVPSATGIALPVQDGGDVVAHLAAAAIDDVVQQGACIAIGPGLGVSDGARSMVLRAIGQDEAPVVVDADGLNNMCNLPDLQRDFRAGAVLTPHIGEFQRLAKSIGGVPELNGKKDHATSAEALAQRLGCIVVLKSASTIVTDGHRSWTHDSPNPALATAGSGDVLTGLIAGLIAQFVKRPFGAGSMTITSEKQGGLGLFDCACLGVLAHSHAARQWADRTGATGGLLARELADELPSVLEAMRD